MKAVKTKQYYVLLVLRQQDSDEPPRWEIEFGDYDRGVVAEERQSYRDSYQYKAKELKIITCGATTQEITRAVAIINAEELQKWSAKQNHA